MLVIGGCPALEELPSPSKLNCLEEIEIESCERLQNITLPTTLTSLSVYGCKVLQGIAEIADLIKLTRLSIVYCPKLEQLPDFARVSCLEKIEIQSCEKLQNITLPRTLVRLSVKGCRVLHRVAGLPDVTKLTELCIAKCPALELPCLGRLICIEEIEIDSCKNLQNIISAAEELHVPKYTRLSYCGYAVTRYFIDRWKSAPRCTCLIGKAVDGAESSLNEHLFSEANFAVDGVTEISTDNLYFDWSGMSAGIVCFVVAIDSSTLAENINETISIWSEYDFKMRQGESVVTVVEYSEDRDDVTWELSGILQNYLRIAKKGFRVDLKEGEEWKSLPVLRTIVDRLYDKE